VAPANQTYYLSLPEIQKGDVIWDLTFTGTTGASLVFTERQNVIGNWISNWFSSLGVYILVGLGIIAAIIAFTPVGKILKKAIIKI